ncbi:hypothetical protein BKA65DRAFT_565890 [Rhexocercosporidium sp. MPI-PUGE-AT-0058]|nr:hypothetical protein BKA65DRAFT_565890 [Rhexocercosporidium sp. MPI-PUGE-AT-0058]
MSSPTPAYAWTAEAVESPEQDAIILSHSSVSPDRTYFNPPVQLLRDSHNPERELLSDAMRNFDPAILDDEKISAGNISDLCIPEPLQQRIDPEILVPGILTADDGQEKSVERRFQHLGGNGYQQAPAATLQSAPSPPSQPSISPTHPPAINHANSARLIGIHTFGEPIYCCGFAIRSFPSGFSEFRQRLLLWASNTSQWSQFESYEPNTIPLPLSQGQWLYEVRQIRRTGDPWSLSPWELKRREFFYGQDLGSTPRILHFTQLGDWLKRLHRFKEGLSICCGIPGHDQMCIIVWMGDEDLEKYSKEDHSVPLSGYIE